MRQEILSRRYAEALADVAEAKGMLADVRKELLELADSARQVRGFQALMRTPVRRRTEKKRFFQRVADEAGLSAITQRLLFYLVDKKRVGLLGRIAGAFATEANRRLGVAKACVTSAAPVDQEQKQRIRERLEELTNKQIQLELELDESLIAGFQVRLDGYFYDGSLRARLKRLRESIAHGE